MKTLALIASILIGISVRSQSISSYALNCSGNSYSQGYYNIDWNVGELALVNTMQSTGQMIVTNGFLQPNLSASDQDQKHRFTASEIRILPNPTHGKIEVNVATSEQGTLYFFVYDARGRALMNDKLLSAGIMVSKFIDLTSLPASSYLVRIELVPSASSIAKSGSYKIIKL
ncbi:MAG: hypothetical protein ACXVKK_10405 [Flavisolibacter sp.]